MKLSKLYLASKKKNLTEKLGFTDYFNYDFIKYCNICKKTRFMVKGTSVCSDCLLYK